MAHLISSLSDLQNQYGGSYPISLSEYYHNGNYVNNNNVPSGGTISFSSYVANTPVYTCTSNYALNHTCIRQNNGFNINLNTVANWLSNTQAIYQQSFPNAFLYAYDAGSPVPDHIDDGGNDMFDGGNYITVTSSCIGGVSNQTYSNIPYGNILGEATHGVMVASASNWPHLTLAYFQSDSARIYATGDTGSDGGGRVSNIPVQNYSTSNNRYGSIWTCINGLAYDPSIIDVWFTVENSNWNSQIISTDDQRKTTDTNSYSHYVGVTGSNFILAKALVSLSNGQMTDASSVTDFVKTLTYNMPLVVTSSNINQNRHNDVCVYY